MWIIIRLNDKYTFNLLDYDYTYFFLNEKNIFVSVDIMIMYSDLLLSIYNYHLWIYNNKKYLNKSERIYYICG